MKDKFPGCYRPTDEAFRALWDTATFVFDANVLLNTYRYSSEAADKLLELMRAFANRVWIPNRFAYEYHCRRAEVIFEQAGHYEAVIDRLKQILETDFKSRRKHPFLESELLAKFDALCRELEASLQGSRQRHQALLRQDGYLDALTELFLGKTGDPYPEATEVSHFESAKKRYLRKTPPGYRDEKKPEPERYGDYLAWRQILDYAKQAKCPVILVTDDAKEDWWHQLRGDVTIGPRRELVEEFERETGHRFYMYSVDEFMTRAGAHLGAEVPVQVIQEAKEQREKLASDKSALKAEPAATFVRPTDLKPDGELNQGGESTAQPGGPGGGHSVPEKGA